MSAVAQQLLTAEDLVRLHGGDHVELIDGVVKELPMPKRPHGLVSNQIAFAITTHVTKQSLGRVAINDTFVLTQRNPDRVRGADLAYWSYNRLPPGPVSDEIAGPPPELVVEVRSPSDRWKDVIAKVGEYLQAGIDVVVVLDPPAGTATVYRPDEFQQVFHNGDELIIPDLFPGFSVRLADLFKDVNR